MEYNSEIFNLTFNQQMSELYSSQGKEVPIFYQDYNYKDYYNQYYNSKFNPKSNKNTSGKNITGFEYSISKSTKNIDTKKKSLIETNNKKEKKSIFNNLFKRKLFNPKLETDIRPSLSSNDSECPLLELNSL